MTQTMWRLPVFRLAEDFVREAILVTGNVLIHVATVDSRLLPFNFLVGITRIPSSGTYTP